MRRQNVVTFGEKGLDAAHEARYMATYQGVGYKEFRDKHSNEWITAEATGFRPVREPVIREGDDTYKPGVLLSKDDSCWVLDVAVPWETQDALSRRHADKCRKYERLKQAACKLTETKHFNTGSIVIGARGPGARRMISLLRI
ncbi:hypothetical protein M514_09935 [Trichuris suis]|uniref:Uncharacterized protein n=1 Tax=Trichuris suis TaxID=68888 RepID=A0A085LW67_9BILA|nr:hypothetical protein M513_09935 [Trichuris suis]KFD64308.1 hypothetical protein M514_09935 [Trichuris suis]